MYGYSQGNYGSYGSAYTAAAAAAAVYGNLGVGQSTQAQQQSSSVFGSSTTNPYATYSNSVAASYGYGSQSTNAASVYAAQAAQAQVQASQVSRLSADAAYAAAAGVAPSQYSAFGTGQLAVSGFGSAQANAGATVGYGRPSATASNQAAKSLAALTNSSNKSALAVNSSSTYSNYDAAVYAAASSYLHSKATGTTNMWMSKKPGGAGRGGGFANKRFGAGGGTQKEAQQFYCEVCKISCAGQLTYKEHLEGQRHKKKEALAKGENNPSLPKSKVSFRCDLCNVTCTGQDTYNAHVRGAKHQKTLTLCKKLGKPIPSTEPTIIPPSEMGGVIPPPPTATTTAAAAAGANNSAKRVVGISTVSFVAGAKLSSTAGQLEAKKQQVMQAVGSAGAKPADDSTVQAIKGQTEELQALIAAEQNLKPVGEEFVEAQRDATGKLLQYLCKLCDCKFSDPNAKEIHLKGRRHRLQYKMKVDPNLEVEVKQASNKRGAKYERGRGPMGVIPRGPPATGMVMQRGPFGPAAPGIRGPWFGNGPIDGRRFETTDDRHVQAKHTSIYPDDEQLTVIERLVTETEKALKKVSDYFNERDQLDTKPQVKTPTAGEGAKDTVSQEKDRLLKGVMRVGMLSKGLLLKDDTEVHLVVLCSHIPGLSLLKEVATLIPKYYESPEGSSINITVEEETSSMILQQSSIPLKCRISLTSREFREDAAGDATPAPPPGDALNKEACLKALAQLRHAKWFQARCIYLQSCQVTLRILRDIRARIESWRPLDDWMCELLVEKVLSSCLAPLSVGDALRRFFEAVASGVLLKTGPGLADPCEKESVDVLAPLSGQEREAITASAQHALRLIAFNQIYKVLCLDRLPDVRPPLTDRKRPMDTSNASDEIKKDKKEGEDGHKTEEENSAVAVKMEKMEV
ncbi:hypothetical protein RB195_007709 [Necator americanus]|uniref:DZF domain-containing protein n=3 Tax=Necator americanus TaxID=51031 RepID=A0ABR1BYJ4_NECAM